MSNHTVVTVSVCIALLFSRLCAADDCLHLHVIQNEPIGYIDEAGQPTGVHWDYLSAIESLSGICIKKELMPYARVWLGIQNGLHDGGIIFRSPKREQFVLPVVKIRTLETVIFPRRGITINTYEDLKDLFIGKTKGTRLSDRFDQDDKLKKVDLTNYDMAANMLKLGRIDAIAGSQVVLTYQLSKHGVLDALSLEKPFVLGRREQWLQLSTQSAHTGIANTLREAVETLRSQGVLDQIMSKYHGQNWSLNNAQ